MTIFITRTTPESPANTRIDSHQIEPHLAKSGQIWTDSDITPPNSQPTAALPSDRARIPAPLRPFRVGSPRFGRADAVRYHRS